MTESTGPERRTSSLKSLLDRLEEAETGGDAGSNTGGNTGAGQSIPRIGPQGRAVPVPPSVPARRPHAELTSEMDKELSRAIERRAQMVDETASTYRLPLILGGAAVAGAVVAMPIAYWLLSGTQFETSGKAATNKAPVIRAVETTVVTAEQIQPQRNIAPPVQEAAPTPPPRLVQPPEQRSRRVGVEEIVPPIARAATEVVPPPQNVPAFAAIAQQPVAPAPVAPPAQLAPPRAVTEAAMAVRSGQRIAFPIRVEPAAALASVSRVVVRGLPANVIIPQSARGPAGSVVVGIEALPALQLDTSGAAAGDAELEIELQGVGNAVLDRTMTVLKILPVAIAPAVAREAPPPPPRVEASNPRADAFYAKGKDLLSSGDVAGARLMLERAVDVGSPAAALLLGETYDPAGLQSRGVRGITPDLKQARTWYEKARSLGVGAAEDKLLRLQQR